MIERLKTLKFMFTFVGTCFLKQHANNILIDENLQNIYNGDAELKQALVTLMFQHAYENIDKNIPAPESFPIAKDSYLDDRDVVKLLLDEFVIKM